MRRFGPASESPFRLQRKFIAAPTAISSVIVGLVFGLLMVAMVLVAFAAQGQTPVWIALLAYFPVSVGVALYIHAVRPDKGLSREERLATEVPYVQPPIVVATELVSRHPRLARLVAVGSILYAIQRIFELAKAPNDLGIWIQLVVSLSASLASTVAIRRSVRHPPAQDP